MTAHPPGPQQARAAAEGAGIPMRRRFARASGTDGAPRRPCLRNVLLGLLATLATALLALWLVLRLLLAPTPGEWATTLRAGPWGTEVGVPSLLRLVSAPWFGPWLDGRQRDTRWGPVRLQWHAATHTLQLHCAPCRIPVTALGEEALQVPRLTVSLRRSFDALEGSVIASTAQASPAVVQASFTGHLRQDGMALHLQARATPIVDWYAVLAPRLPELQQARITGTLALQARWSLPDNRLQLQPEVAGFTVQGLGTEVLAHAASGCGKPSRLGAKDWLTRAVLAAEDQRFFEHPGYDLQELQAALKANQAGDGVRRGGSTLNQQLAKRLVTGDERSAGRKLRELLYAVEMEQTLGKARILQLYLDNAPWGAGLCGAEAAARHYFQRSARTLQPAQAVWLAAMLHNPDAEAGAWTRDGGINLARAEWVAQGVRGVPRTGPRQREAVLAALQAMAAP